MIALSKGSFSAHNSLKQACNNYSSDNNVPKKSNFATLQNESRRVRAIACLKMETAHNMINAFWIEKKMTKNELAAVLEINIADFEKFYSDCGSKEFMSEISYRLIVLYCRTRWNYYQRRTN